MSKERTSASRYCAVPTCTNNSNKNEGYSFFCFPKDKDRALQWICNCKREDLLNKDVTQVSKATYMCGKHFENHMFLNDLHNRLHLHAIPTIFEETLSEAEAFHSADDQSSEGKRKYILLETKQESTEYEPREKIRILPITSLDKSTAPTASSATESVEPTSFQQSLDLTQPSTSSVALQTEQALSAGTPRKKKLQELLKKAQKPSCSPLYFS